MKSSESADEAQNEVGDGSVGKVMRARSLTAATICGTAIMMIGAGVGDAASPPAVTDSPTAVTSTSAALNGVVRPGGIATDWEFQWGTSTSYGHNTTLSGPLTDTGSDAVMAPIGDLTPDTTYHYRVIVVQGAAQMSGNPTVSAGGDMSFKTGTAGSGTPAGGNSGKHARASLLSHSLTVHHGTTLISWGCSGTAGAICKGKISLSARGKIGGKLETVSCGGGTFTASTGRHHTVRATLGGQCTSLVQKARHHRLGASLKATFSQGTGNLKTAVTLAL